MEKKCTGCKKLKSVNEKGYVCPVCGDYFCQECGEEEIEKEQKKKKFPYCPVCEIIMELIE